MSAARLRHVSQALLAAICKCTYLCKVSKAEADLPKLQQQHGPAASAENPWHLRLSPKHSGLYDYSKTEICISDNAMIFAYAVVHL